MTLASIQRSQPQIQTTNLPWNDPVQMTFKRIWTLPDTMSNAIHIVYNHRWKLVEEWHQVVKSG